MSYKIEILDYPAGNSSLFYVWELPNRAVWFRRDGVLTPASCVLRRQSGTPPMRSCAGAGSWYGVVVSAGTRKGSTSEWLAQETSAITTTESAETRIIDFFMAGNCR